MGLYNHSIIRTIAKITETGFFSSPPYWTLSFEGDLLCFSFILLPFLHCVICVQVHTNSSPLPQKTLVLKRLVCSLLDITHHHVTFAWFMLIFMVKWKLTGSWKRDRSDHRQSEQGWLRYVWADQSEQTGHSGGGPLKRQEPKQSEEIQSLRTVQY